MKEREDYSGDFDPNFKLADLSKDALHRLSIANAKCYIMMARLWYDLVRERFGDETAKELDLEIWGQRALPLESSWVCEALNIRGNDVAALFKLFQDGKIRHDAINQCPDQNKKGAERGEKNGNQPDKAENN